MLPRTIEYRVFRNGGGAASGDGDAVQTVRAQPHFFTFLGGDRERWGGKPQPHTRNAWQGRASAGLVRRIL